MRAQFRRSGSIRRSSRSFLLVLPPLMLLLIGCAVQKAYRFAPKSITKVSYDPNRCVEMQDGRFKCKEVVFTVSAIESAKAK